ncbi:hypothetical protein UVI_02044830 [Ustilaginoidea virens]|uniref:Uncharacterized protein n=1 Tax=Ustilaginoidea virens TaxID=1159556 RepID=A0A063BYG2_USTVR|nr:hypothetical protein UVI_02044830 [Ustilaginoidea virens]
MEIIPAPPTDQIKPVDNIRTCTFFIVRELLDQGRLKNALDDLIRHHWRKLGGRLVSRPRDKRLEYQVPDKFDDHHVLFNWSSATYGHSIDKVPAVVCSPPQDRGVLLLPPVEEVDSRFRPAEWPLHRRDEPPDAPLLYVHLSLFEDATIICISAPHALGDQMGLGNMMRAWLGLVDGKTPPPMVGYRGDLMPGADRPYADWPRHEVCRKGKQRILGMVEYFLVLIIVILDLAVNPREKRHVMFIPLPLIRSLRERYSKTLAEKHSDFTRISDGDVVTAIAFKVRLTNAPPNVYHS